jgi:hypothetical protein
MNLSNSINAESVDAQLQQWKIMYTLAGGKKSNKQ